MYSLEQLQGGKQVPLQEVAHASTTFRVSDPIFVPNLSRYLHALDILVRRHVDVASDSPSSLVDLFWICSRSFDI